MEYGRDYFTRHFTTEWADTKNVVVSLYEAADPLHLQIGIIEVRLFRGESKYKGEAYIWNLWVSEGNVHMSESRLCPSVGNVNTDDFADIWQRMRAFRPCGHCRQYRKFMESPRPDIAAARAVMGL